MTAPIALFVYKRQSHTRQTVEALKKNILAKDSDLIIYSDAPKNSEDILAVEEVREYIKTITGFLSVNVVLRAHNYGLANSIIDGVTAILKQYGSIIVLEDDIVSSEYFLTFMNRSLEKFQSEENVMQISGNMFPIRPEEYLPETFFCRMTTSWGWATWARAWNKFEPDAGKLKKEIASRNLRREFDMDYYYFRMLEMQANGALDSWAIRWYASVFLADGLCLHPATSLVVNIGFDGSGTHCGEGREYEMPLAGKSPEEFPVLIEESIKGRQALEAFHRTLYHPTRKFYGYGLIARTISALRAWVRIH